MSQVSRRTLFAAGAVAGAASVVGGSLPVGHAEERDRSSIGKTPHTKFAVNIEMWWKKLPFLERIEKTAELGFPAIEFWPFDNKEHDAVAEKCQKLGIEIAQFTAWGFKPHLNDPKNETAFLKTIERACEVAKKWQCRKMTVVAGDNTPGMSREAMHEQVIQALKKAAPIVEQAKVMLILEPMNERVDHPGHCLYGSVDAVKICRAVASPMVKINWDLYHMQITEGDLCGRLKDGFDQVGYLQLADHPGRHEPGTGEIYYNRVLRQAFELGYKDFVGLELNPTDELKAAQAVAAADVW
jgi:hydroxypyruvate isomerase